MIATLTGKGMGDGKRGGGRNWSANDDKEGSSQRHFWGESAVPTEIMSKTAVQGENHNDDCGQFTQNEGGVNPSYLPHSTEGRKKKRKS